MTVPYAPDAPDAPERPVIRARGLTMTYGDVDVLRGVDLDVHRGEVCALLGPNDAGKTTTVEILEGFRRRSAGDVSVLGVDPEHGDDARPAANPAPGSPSATAGRICRARTCRWDLP